MPSVLDFSAHLPQRRVDNEELAALLQVDSQWIVEACGIQERRYAAAGETVVDLAVFVTARSLSQTGHLPNEDAARIQQQFQPEKP